MSDVTVNDAAGVVADGAVGAGVGAITGSMWLNAGSSVLSAMLGSGSSAPPAVSSAALDGSHWTVSTGGGDATGGGLGLPWYVWAAVIAAGLIWLKKRKG